MVLIGQPRLCLLQSNLARGQIPGFPVAFLSPWKAWLALARLWVSNQDMWEMEGDPKEVTEPSTAMAREVSRPYVTECYFWSLPLPVPPPLERLDGLLLSEQLKHPARERGKHWPRCRPHQASQAGTACPLFGCLTLPLPSPHLASLGHTLCNWDVGYSEPCFRWGWEGGAWAYTIYCLFVCLFVLGEVVPGTICPKL